ncbi:MAG: GH92 family glycosyl hydrolase [Rikenellaceae bacterium]|nr:GH92 family glycosyl hydrolase [Rikenellaceae bacterium]
MKKLKTLLALCAIFPALAGTAAAPDAPAGDPVDFVSVLTGTQSDFALSTGNTYPAIARPWGMNFWTPQTGEMGNGWAYSYDARKIRGLKQTHQPSPWINDYGQFAIMPVVGHKLGQDDRASFFSHKAETATPYYYGVYLADYDIRAELTPTDRAAAFRFTFPASDESGVVIDAFDGGSYVKVLPESRTVIGYTTKNTGGVPDNFKNYFVLVFDRPFDAYEVWSGDGEVHPGKAELEAPQAGALVRFKTRRGEQVGVQVASSFIGFDQAYQNLKELDGKSFEQVSAEGRDRWNEVLGRIEVEGGTLDQFRTFYSCLYRSVLFPRKLYEIDAAGNPVHYSPYNGQVLPGYMYTDTGFWDTFRCLFPLLNLVYPSVNDEIQAGLVNTYLESGFLPEWASPGHRPCMVGNNSASVVADAMVKGRKGYDIAKLYEAMQHGANNVHPTVSSTGRLGHEHYNSLGYVPYDVKVPENVARTLEYAYDDWAILQVAKRLGRPQAEIAELEKRCQNFRNVFDPETRLMRGRNADGSFQTPFNPYKWGDAFTEGNSWHYTWSVFHDVEALAGLMGGHKAMETMLDSVFVVPPVFDDSYYGFTIHEIREMQIMNMGNYAHGNQPIQHMIYLYNYVGAPWKAQYWVREVMDRMYTPNPDGYCGDEDNGQTSAWYVFSALGFYPVCPATDEYVMGAPLFRKATVTFEDGRKLVIEADANSAANRYIAEARLNGKPYTKNYLRHGDLTRGATLKFRMAAEPNLKRGTDPGDFPYSFSNEKKGAQ